MDLEKQRGKRRKMNPSKRNQTLLNMLFQEGTMISIRAKRRAEKSTKTGRRTKNNKRRASGREIWAGTETMGL